MGHSCAGKAAIVITAMERRFNFAAGDTEARAHAFDYFSAFLEPDVNGEGSVSDKGPQLAASPLDWQSVPQWLQYERGRDLELWILTVRT